jgi:hypothetical protein
MIHRNRKVHGLPAIDNPSTIRSNPSIRQEQEGKVDAVYEPGTGGGTVRGRSTKYVPAGNHG